MLKTPMLEPYEAPQVSLVRLDTSCQLMQESLTAPSDEGFIPDLVVEPLDWIL